MPSRGILTLSGSTKEKKIIPPLRDVVTTVKVMISEPTLLAYQNDLKTNSTYFKLKLQIDPNKKLDSLEGQHLLVNALSSESQITLDYDFSMFDIGDHDHEPIDEQLVQIAEERANAKLEQELSQVTDILTSVEGSILECVSEKLFTCLGRYPDKPKVVEVPKNIPLLEKPRYTYLNWREFLSSCTTSFIEREIGPLYSEEQPFVFIDVKKIPPLAAVFGFLGLDEENPGNDGPFQYADNGFVRVGLTEQYENQEVLHGLILAYQLFLKQISKGPIGALYRESVHAAYGIPEEFLIASTEVVRAVEEKRSKKIAARTTDYARILCEELGDPAKRLRLAIEQDYYWKVIYYDLLTNYIKNDLNDYLCDKVQAIYPDRRRPYHPLVHFAGPGTHWVNDKVFAQMAESFSPSLLALQLNQEVQNYFSDHPWLSKLNIKAPTVKIVIDPYAEIPSGMPRPKEPPEFFLISRYYSGPPVPQNNQMAVSIFELEYWLSSKDSNPVCPE